LYRPTIRYNERYRTFIDDVFVYSRLDRNQILRLALHIASHSEEFQKVIEKHSRRKDVPLPQPTWNISDHCLWMDNRIIEVERKEEEQVRAGDVSDEIFSGETRTTTAEQSTGINESIVNANDYESTTGNEQEQQYRCIEQSQRSTWEIPSIPIFRDGRILCREQGGIRVTFNAN